jgi:hypothetical protein
MNYISHVTNKNKNAYDRIYNDFSVYGTPTTYFDGGAEVRVGGGSGNKAAFLAAISTCNARPTRDVDVDVSVQWLSDHTMRITVTVTNNETDGYRGKLKVFVCEHEATQSSWKDSAQHPYTHAFLAYAFKEELVLAGLEVWQDSVIWDGAQFDDGYGNDFSYITYVNTQVIATVFDSTWHQGYGYPPTGKPFDAYYLDDMDWAGADNFSADTYTIPEAGGTVNLGLYAATFGGPTYRLRDYIIVGGVSGTLPGTVLPGGKTLPINWDYFSDIVMSLVNTSLFPNFLSKLGVDGSSTAQINAPALPPGTAGLIMNFAYCTGNPFDFVSIPIEIEVVP